MYLSHTVTPVVGALHVLDVINSIEGHNGGLASKVLGVVGGPVSSQTVIVT